MLTDPQGGRENLRGMEQWSVLRQGVTRGLPGFQLW